MQDFVLADGQKDPSTVLVTNSYWQRKIPFEFTLVPDVFVVVVVVKLAAADGTGTVKLV